MDNKTANPVWQDFKGWKVWLAIFVGSVVFVVVLTGTIEATGAPPGGVLRGRGAFFLSMVIHALSGALMTWLNLIGWGALLGIIFALIGAFRHKCRWFTPLLWVALVPVVTISYYAIQAMQNWLGSVSPGLWDGAHTWSPPFWDAAAFGGASALVCTVLLVTSPAFVRGLWKWNNGGSFGAAEVWFMVPMYSIGVALVFVPLALMWAVF